MNDEIPVALMVPELTALCRSFLERTSARARLLSPTGSRLEGPPSDSFHAAISASFNAALHDVMRQLPDLGLQHRILFGFTDLVLERDSPSVDEHTSRPDAVAALDDAYTAKADSGVFYLLFTSTFSQELFLTFDQFRQIPGALPPIEPAVLGIDAGDPGHASEPFDVLYAFNLAAIALEFAFHHELSHVICGHLTRMAELSPYATMYAVGREPVEDTTLATMFKVYEIDADLMAILQLIGNLRAGRFLVANLSSDSCTRESAFVMLGFAVTVLFRLIEQWRREVNPIYTQDEQHPHPDVRDGCLAAYMSKNASPDEGEAERAYAGYTRGRMAAIEAITRAGNIATFEVIDGAGQDVAFREVSRLVEETNLLRRAGVCDTDFRRLAQRLRR